MYRYFMLVFVGLSLTQGVSSHSAVAFVTPKDGAILREAPKMIEIVFTGTSMLVDVSVRKLEEEQKPSLLDDLLGISKGKDIQLGSDHLMINSKLHLIAIPDLSHGTYQTTWRAISEDGHTIKGDFSFKISPDGIQTMATKQMELRGEGKVKRIRGNMITIKQGGIGDVMPAMTMEYELPDGFAIENLSKDDTVVFELSKSLEIIKISKKL